MRPFCYRPDFAYGVCHMTSVSATFEAFTEVSLVTFLLPTLREYSNCPSPYYTSPKSPYPFKKHHIKPECSDLRAPPGTYMWTLRRCESAAKGAYILFGIRNPITNTIIYEKSCSHLSISIFSCPLIRCKVREEMKAWHLQEVFTTRKKISFPFFSAHAGLYPSCIHLQK